MVTGVIIDDEENNIVNLQLLLQKHCSGITVAATANNANDGITIIQQYKPDVVFLDIQMPGKNGFQLLQALPQTDFEIIFITAYDKYGIQAVKIAALDYLLKPIKTAELQQAVQKAIAKSSAKKQNLQLEHFIALLQQNQNKEEQRIALPAIKETRFIQIKDIIRCESDNSYTFFYLSNGERILVSRPIYEYEELLSPYGFIRCHQSHLVSKRFIKSWVKTDGDYLLLEDSTQIPIARQKKAAIKALLIQNN
ncbi:MAG TPA: LytTR family DNA-binding domain-containing protein [Hanamia sp.]